MKPGVEEGSSPLLTVMSWGSRVGENRNVPRRSPRARGTRFLTVAQTRISRAEGGGDRGETTSRHRRRVDSDRNRNPYTPPRTTTPHPSLWVIPTR